MKAVLSSETKALLTRFQRIEETDHVIFKKMAALERRRHNRETLLRLAEDEKEHAEIWKRYGGCSRGPNYWHVAWFLLLAYIFGYTFVLKLMENGEAFTAREYRALDLDIPELPLLVEQEEDHEKALAETLNEDRLRYIGAMVLGLNDALVELTGTLAGLSFALANTRLVALAGIITGVSATMSMAASNYLAERTNNNRNALKSCFYTGAAYLLTVICLVLPYLLFPHQMYVYALLTMLVIVILIIFCFNYYVSVAQSQPFARRFGEMTCISLGMAVLSFVVGLLAKEVLGIAM